MVQNIKNGDVRHSCGEEGLGRLWYISHTSYMYVRLGGPLDAGCEGNLGVKEHAEDWNRPLR